MTSLVTSVRRGNLNRSLAAARAPVWEQTSDLRRSSRAFGDFHQFMEWEGYYGEALRRHRSPLQVHGIPIHVQPRHEARAAALAPVLQAVRQGYDLVHCLIWAAMDRATTGTHSMKPVRFWDTDLMVVEQDDEGHAVVRYCLDHDDRFFEPAWCYYPD